MNLLSKLSPRLRRYLLVGVSAFATEYLSFTLLFSVFKIDPSLAHPASFLLGLIVSFIGSRYITFKPRADEIHSRGAAAQVSSFLALGLLNMFISTTLIVLIIKYVGLHPILAKLLVMSMIIVWNYLIMGRLIFKTKQNS